MTNDLGQPVGEPIGDWTPPPPPRRTALDGRYCRVEPLDATRHTQELWEANAHDREHRNWTYLTHGPYATHAEYDDYLRRAAAASDPLVFAVIALDPPSDRRVDHPEGDSAGDKRRDEDGGGRVGHSAGTWGRAAGVAAYLRISPDAGSIEVGHINFSPLLQRTRAATEAMYLMMKHAFAVGYRRYEWKCDALNGPSRAAAARLGFTFEGVFRQATVCKGRNRDTAWYAVIDKEWPALQAAFDQWLAPDNFDAHGQQRIRLSDLTRGLAIE